MKNWMWLLVLAGIWFFLSAFFVSSGSIVGIPFSILFAFGVVSLLSGFGVKFAQLPVMNKKQQQYTGALLLVALFFLGAFSNLMSGITLPTGSVQGSPAQAGCSVSTELKGKTATLTINAYDRESTTTSNVEVPYRLYKNGGYLVSGTDTIDGSVTTGVVVGDVITVVGGNGTYYLDSKEICIDTQAMPVVLDAHDAAAESEMVIAAYDDTGSTALDTPDGTYSAQQEDYEFNMGSSDAKKIYVKSSVNAAYTSRNLAAIAIAMYEGVADTIDDVVLNEPGWSKTLVPKYLANTVFQLNDTTATSNTTEGYDVLYKRDAGPKLMHNWEEVKYPFTIDTGTGTIAEDDDATPTAEVAVIIGFFDAAWAQGSDLNDYHDYYQHDSSEGNVGLSEILFSPLGKQTAIVIELK